MWLKLNRAIPVSTSTKHDPITDPSRSLRAERACRLHPDIFSALNRMTHLLETQKPPVEFADQNRTPSIWLTISPTAEAEINIPIATTRLYLNFFSETDV